MSLSRSQDRVELPQDTEVVHVELERLKRFEQDNDRSNVATNQITKYVQALSVDQWGEVPLDKRRDECLHYLTKERESEYYKNIQQMISTGEKVCATEYYYFALVTDNLQLVDVDLLEDAEQCFQYDNCVQNLELVKAALRFQRAETQDDKKYWNQKLSDAIRYPYSNRLRTLFLNAAGIDISGADLEHVDPRKGSQSCPNLNLADLKGAKLDGCNLFSFDFLYSDLTGASLKNVKGLRHRERQGPRFVSCIARDACLDGIEALHGDYRESDFANASMKGANFVSASFVKSDFTKVNFEGATLEFFDQPNACKFEDAKFIGVKMKSMNFNRCNYETARFLDLSKVHNLADVKSQLSALKGVENFTLDELHAFQGLLADDVLRCAVKCFADPSLQCDVIDAAIAHPHFHHQESTNEWLAENAKSAFNASVGTLFGDCGKFRSSNAAISYLQEQRDAIDSVANPEWSP